MFHRGSFFCVGANAPAPSSSSSSSSSSSAGASGSKNVSFSSPSNPSIASGSFLGSSLDTRTLNAQLPPFDSAASSGDTTRPVSGVVDPSEARQRLSSRTLEVGQEPDVRARRFGRAVRGGDDDALSVLAHVVNSQVVPRALEDAAARERADKREVRMAREERVAKVRRRVHVLEDARDHHRGAVRRVRGRAGVVPVVLRDGFLDACLRRGRKARGKRRRT
eukprot:29255-Pelagococcus_subviridis.AAC.3